MDSTTSAEACDCTADCGDDPRIRRGEARPCERYLMGSRHAAEARDKEHRRLNYAICTAIDMTKLGTVLADMEAIGVIDAAEHRALNRAAAAVLALARQANDRGFGKPPSSMI